MSPKGMSPNARPRTQCATVHGQPRLSTPPAAYPATPETDKRLPGVCQERASRGSRCSPISTPQAKLRRREINRFIDKLLNQPGYSVLTSTAGQVPASRYPIWVTWEDENPNSDPFAFANSNSADHVRACLGLVSQRRGRSPQLLLFVYNHTSGQPLYRPTVADAANYTYFRPPLPEQGDAHGWTLPWSRHELPGNVQHEAIRPRPEALIAPCPLSNLRLPLRCFS
jgi:hypothetical protein